RRTVSLLASPVAERTSRSSWVMLAGARIVLGGGHGIVAAEGSVGSAGGPGIATTRQSSGWMPHSSNIRSTYRSAGVRRPVTQWPTSWRLTPSGVAMESCEDVVMIASRASDPRVRRSSWCAFIERGPPGARRCHSPLFHPSGSHSLDKRLELVNVHPTRVRSSGRGRVARRYGSVAPRYKRGARQGDGASTGAGGAFGAAGVFSRMGALGPAECDLLRGHVTELVEQRVDPARRAPVRWERPHGPVERPREGDQKRMAPIPEGGGTQRLDPLPGFPHRML